MPTIAFFDLDGTLIKPISLLSFYSFLHERYAGITAMTPDELVRTVVDMRARKVDRQEINASFYKNCFCGVKVETVRTLAQEWFGQQISSGEFFIDPVIDALQMHQAAGIECVIVTGSCFQIVEPIAAFLNIPSILAAPLVETEGAFTGELYEQPMIGPGKLNAVLKYVQSRDASLGECFGYGDDETDHAFLKALGMPSLVIQDERNPKVIPQTNWGKWVLGPVKNARTI